MYVMVRMDSTNLDERRRFSKRIPADIYRGILWELPPAELRAVGSIVGFVVGIPARGSAGTSIEGQDRAEFHVCDDAGDTMPHVACL